MKLTFRHKRKIRIFTWFRLGLLLVLLLAAGSLYTPYPVELLKQFQEDGQTTRKKKKRKLIKKVAPVAKPSAPVAPPLW